MNEDRQYYLVSPLAYTGAATAFTYHATQTLTPGQIVQIPLGRRLSLGIVIQATPKPSFTTRAVTAVLELPTLPPDLLSLGQWLAAYYAASPSSVWSTMLPAGLGRNRRSKPPKAVPPPQGLPAHPLTPDQATTLTTIRTSPKTTHLIQGVTGSGKTRIYLELASDALAAGRSVIILVPEITLTPQVIGQFETAFGDIVLATHSKLTEAQRHHIWSEAMTATTVGQPKIIIGPRSCLFMPVHNLGLIVIDECHETTYKQEQNPRYHAVTAAGKRAQLSGARLILGSATPGLTELFLAKSGRIEHHLLTTRANNISHSQANIIDLRDKELFKLSKFITQNLLTAIQDTLAAGRQSLLYLNRRGSASQPDL